MRSYSVAVATTAGKRIPSHAGVAAQIATVRRQSDDAGERRGESVHQNLAKQKRRALRNLARLPTAHSPLRHRTCFSFPPHFWCVTPEASAATRISGSERPRRRQAFYESNLVPAVAARGGILSQISRRF